MEDMEAIIALRKEIAGYNLQFDAGYTLNVEATELLHIHITATIENSAQCVLVAESNGAIVGYANGYLISSPAIFVAQKKGYIDELGIAEASRKNRIGKAMLDALIEWFKSQGIEKVELKVDARNAAGISFWRKNGFGDVQIRMSKLV